ncbi:MAG: hypothetical protein WCC95_15505, partial [Candidatus Sulfotelmatobacter sp.]
MDAPGFVWLQLLFLNLEQAVKVAAELARRVYNDFVQALIECGASGVRLGCQEALVSRGDGYDLD